MNDEKEPMYPSVALEVVQKEVWRATCFRCGETWNLKDQRIMPKNCAKCNSPYWNKPKLKTGEAASPNKYGFECLRDFKWHGFPFSLDAKDSYGMDWTANARRARSLEQFMRRRDWSYEHKLGKNDAGEVCLMVRRTK